MTATQPAGVLLILRDGRSFMVAGLSATRAKHMRRQGARLTVKDDKGQEIRVSCDDVKNIYPLPPKP